VRFGEWPRHTRDVHRFFFNLHEPGLLALDEEGMLLESFEAAFDHAVHEARQIMAEHVRAGRLQISGRIEIIDAYNITLATLNFTEALGIEA
jgi:hypothetical protein